VLLHVRADGQREQRDGSRPGPAPRAPVRPPPPSSPTASVPAAPVRSQGKTYTMFGSEAGDAPGIIPRAVDYLFRVLRTRAHAKDTAVVISFLEVYMDRVRDLGVAAGGAAPAAESRPGSAKRGPPRPDSALRTTRPDGTTDTTRWYEEASKVTGTFGRRADSDPSLDFGARYAKQSLDVREDAAGNVYVEGLSVLKVDSAEQALEVVRRGMSLRATQETKMNAVSSRSHTVLTLHVLQKDRRTGQTVDGMLNLVDLAGSERLKRSASEGMRQAEARAINSSLTALGKVVVALQAQTLTAAGPGAASSDPTMRASTSDGAHVPYRDGKLTRLLQNSLGGNSFTALVATVHPRGEDVEESLSTLQFAHRCRSVINRPKINVTLKDDEDKDRRIRQLEGEGSMLRRQLAVARVTTKLRLVRLLADVGMSGRILPDGRIRLADGRVLGITMRQAMRARWSRQAIAAALAPGGIYSADGIRRLMASAASDGRGEGAATAAARADDLLAREMPEEGDTPQLEARHALDVPPMSEQDEADAARDEAQQDAGRAEAAAAREAAGGGAMLPRHRQLATRGDRKAAEEAAFASLTGTAASWGEEGKQGGGGASALFPGGLASMRSTAVGAGMQPRTEAATDVIRELKVRVAELTKELRTYKTRASSETGTLRGLAKEQRERAAEARAVAETTTRAARDEVDRTSTSYSRQVAAMMAHSQSLLHDQHELVAAVPRSLRVAESALQEAAEVEGRVRAEEAEARRRAVARAQEAASRELAQAALAHRQTTRSMDDQMARMAARFREWSAKAREREVGLESEVRSLWEYASGLGQVVKELEEGRFPVEVTGAGRRVFRVPPQLLPDDPFGAHPTALAHLRRLLQRESIEAGEEPPPELDLGATGSTGRPGTAPGTASTGRLVLPRGLRRPPARPVDPSNPRRADPAATRGAIAAGLRGVAPSSRPNSRSARPSDGAGASAASLSRSVKLSGPGKSKSAWTSRRRGRTPAGKDGAGQAAAAALEVAVGRTREAFGGIPDGGAEADTGPDDATEPGDGDGGVEGGGTPPDRDERLRRLEEELDARAARGDVDLESDVGAMGDEELRAQVSALRTYVTSGLRRRVEEEIVNDLAEQPSIDYVRTLEQQRDAARARLEEEVAKARDLQIAHNALRRQLERAGRATLGALPADEEVAALLVSRGGATSRAGQGARMAAESTLRSASRQSASERTLPPLSAGGPAGAPRRAAPTGAMGPQKGGSAARGFDPALARGMAQSQSAAQLRMARDKRHGGRR